MKKQKNKGITLIALVITIIILLILAGITISAITGDNGIIGNAGQAKEETEIANEKEIVEKATVQAMGNNKYGNIVENELQEQLDKETGEGKTEATDIGGEFEVVFKDNNRYYIVDKNGNVTEFCGIRLSDKELALSIINGVLPEYTITATKFNITGDIIWESSDTEVATTENGKVVAVNKGKTIITAKCISDGKEYTANCEVEVAEHVDNSYVQYDVEYKDVYTGTQYTQNTGWRLLNQTDNGDGTYDIDIISTGIPAKLYYYGYDNFKEIENTTPTTIGNWAGDSAQRNAFVERYYGVASYNNVYAAAGLLYNFENIVFNVTGTTSTLNKTGIEKEHGGYIEIKNAGEIVEATDSTTGEDLFRTNIASGTVKDIRSINLEDIIGKNPSSDKLQINTEKSKGLFILQNYTPDPHSSSNYWLASPFYNGYERYLYYVDGSGGSTREDGYNAGPFGVRPIISISGVKMIQEEGSYIWKIIK